VDQLVYLFFIHFHPPQKKSAETKHRSSGPDQGTLRNGILASAPFARGAASDASFLSSSAEALDWSFRMKLTCYHANVIPTVTRPS